MAGMAGLAALALDASDGYLRVNYALLGMKLMTLSEWELSQTPIAGLGINNSNKMLMKCKTTFPALLLFMLSIFVLLLRRDQ